MSPVDKDLITIGVVVGATAALTSLVLKKLSVVFWSFF
jgi:hypothetical protein